MATKNYTEAEKIVPFIYSGDVAEYVVTRVSRKPNDCVLLLVTAHVTDQDGNTDCSIPVGATFTVPLNRIRPLLVKSPYGI